MRLPKASKVEVARRKLDIIQSLPQPPPVRERWCLLDLPVSSQSHLPKPNQLEIPLFASAVFWVTFLSKLSAVCCNSLLVSSRVFDPSPFSCSSLFPASCILELIALSALRMSARTLSTCQVLDLTARSYPDATYSAINRCTGLLCEHLALLLNFFAGRVLTS